VSLCPSCGRAIKPEKARNCETCGKVVCLDCLSYFAVHKRSVYRDYYDLVPVCQDCRPRAILSRKLLRMVDEVFGYDEES
jgi:hypothetical protein